MNISGTSQEYEPDQQTSSNLVVTSNFNRLTTAISSTCSHNNFNDVDEFDQTSENSSIMSLNNDQRALLSSNSTADQIGKFSKSLNLVFTLLNFLFISLT